MTSADEERSDNSEAVPEGTMAEQQRFIEKTARGEVQISVYPFVVPEDLRGVNPIGALAPPADPSTIESDELDRFTYRSSGGFNYPREYLDSGFNGRVAARVAASRRRPHDEAAVTALVTAMVEEFELVSQSLVRSRSRRRLRDRFLHRPGVREPVPIEDSPRSSVPRHVRRDSPPQ